MCKYDVRNVEEYDKSDQADLWVRYVDIVRLDDLLQNNVGFVDVN